MNRISTLIAHNTTDAELAVTWLSARLKATAKLITEATDFRVRVSCRAIDAGHLSVTIFHRSEALQTAILTLESCQEGSGTGRREQGGTLREFATEIAEDLAQAAGSDLATLRYCSDRLHSFCSSLTEEDRGHGLRSNGPCVDWAA
jgi:hypothetical protein